MAYCLVDGKVDQESKFETNLYNELLKQIKQKAGFDTRIADIQVLVQSVPKKPKQNIPRLSKAVIWLYLQIIGTPVERLLSKERLWTFDRDDFEKAYLFLTFKSPARNPSALEMRELISKHFSTQSELAEWLNDIYDKVISKIMDFIYKTNGKDLQEFIT